MRPFTLLLLLTGCLSEAESDSVATDDSTEIIDESCEFEPTAAELAGSGAIDCGLVEAGADGTSAWACAIAAHDAGSAFHVRTQQWGIDTLIETAIVSNGSQSWKIYQDHEGYGPWRIQGWDCLDITTSTQPDDPMNEADVFGYPILVCGSLVPDGNHYNVCGEPCNCSPEPLPFDG